MNTMIRKRLSLSVVLAAAAALASGCGSSTHASTGRRPAGATSQGGIATTASTTAVAPLCPVGAVHCVTTNPAAPVVGPKDVTQNLLAAVHHDHRDLSHVALVCYRVVGFPKLCTMTAMWKLATNPPVPVRGQLTAFGVYTGTSTYAYQLTYNQVGGPKLHRPPQPRHKAPVAPARRHH
jgi:hypothetical protein